MFAQHDSGELVAGSDASSGPRYSAPALEKALDILEVLASEPDGLAMTAIAEQVGRRITEIYRVVQCLQARGYVERSTADQYALSLRLFELAHRHPPMRSLLRRARPVMERLATDTEQSCHLAVLHDSAVRIVAQADSPRSMQYAVRMGASFPILETSSGLVLTAFAGQHQQAALLNRLSQSAGEKLLPMLARIRHNGGDRRTSLTVGGVVNLSRPVLDVDGQALAALTIPFLAFRHERDGERNAAALLAAAAAELSLSPPAIPSPKEVAKLIKR